MNNTKNLLKVIYFWLLGMRSTFDRSQLQLRFEVVSAGVFRFEVVSGGVFRDHLEIIASYLFNLRVVFYYVYRIRVVGSLVDID